MADYHKELDYSLVLLRRTGPHANIYAWIDACDKVLAPHCTGRPIPNEAIQQMVELRRKYNIDTEDRDTVNRLECEHSVAWYARRKGISMAESARRLLDFVRETDRGDGIRDLWEQYLPEIAGDKQVKGE